MPGTASREQSGSVVPPLLELLLTGLPPLELDPPLLLEVPPLEPPLLEPVPPLELVPLLDPPPPGSPSLRSARPIQPATSVAIAIGTNKDGRRGKGIVQISAACVPRRHFPRMAENKAFRQMRGVPK
jgi:hypothetical protein